MPDTCERFVECPVYSKEVGQDAFDKRVFEIR